MLLGIQPGLGPKTRRYGQTALSILDDLGLDVRTRVNILAALNNYVFGFIHREIAWEQTRQRSGLTDEQWSAHVRTHIDEARQRDPEFAEPWEANVALDNRESFEFGLDCFVEGVAVLVAG